MALIGCGGNRDSSKRPIMGQVAAKIADEIIITDDNPRDEDPKFIRQHIIRSRQNYIKCRQFKILGAFTASCQNNKGQTSYISSYLISYIQIISKTNYKMCEIFLMQIQYE